MADDQDNAGVEAAPKKPPKIKANDNPWYLLATLYGEPDDEPDVYLRGKLTDRNRVAWNRYYSINLDDETRAWLIGKKQHEAEELEPFSEEEARQIAIDFAARRLGAGADPFLPSASEQIDFKRVEFGRDAEFSGYLFTSSESARRIGYPFRSGASFRGSTFFGKAIFTGATFYGGADFIGATFCVSAAFVESAMLFGVTDFTSATFSGVADFRNATFNGASRFKGATFNYCVSFICTIFYGGADFDGATFLEGADFESANLSAGVFSFRNTTYSGYTCFKGTTFSGLTDFANAKFQAYAWFPTTIFSDQSSFENTIFCDLVNFTNATFLRAPDFVNVEFRAETSFESATFKTEPPKFFGAKFHEGTIWPDYEFWPVPKVPDTAKKFIRAYEPLKLEMDRLKKHEDELNFFALELRSRRVLLGPRKGLPIAIYGAVADYGRSYWIPLGWLVGVVFVGAMLLLPYFDLTPNQPLLSSLGQSFGLSLANTLNVFGFRKDFIETALVERLPWWLKMLSGLQTILGGVLLFLFGLGIRNRFRMK